MEIKGNTLIEVIETIINEYGIDVILTGIVAVCESKRAALQCSENILNWDNRWYLLKQRISDIIG